jgi:hypothetical protein
MITKNIALSYKCALMKNSLNEAQWRNYLGAEALSIGHGGINQVRLASGVDFKTIKKGVEEIKKGKTYKLGNKIRISGGGRKKLSSHNPNLLKVLEKIANPKGDPESPIRWTSYSMKHISKAVKELGYDVSVMSVYRMLKLLGFGLRANKKEIEGKNHPDRDAQFQHISKSGLKYKLRGIPIISVDCKKKELIGNFKNNGKEWQPKGQNTKVNVYDFVSLADGKAVPYGIYDIFQKVGFVNIGINHDTAEFSVESIRRWWNKIGSTLYPKSKEIYILADGGGSNASRNKLWKVSLQKLSNETNLTIHVSHYPPGTSKWNAIEHELFSYISINWRGKPLTSLETIIELVSHTATKSGLKVIAMKDSNTYEIGKKITEKQFSEINLTRDNILGDWNYTISPLHK